MILRNTLIDTEKLTLISGFRIVSRLRCVIFILISFICILLGQNNCFAQAFISKIDVSKYPLSSTNPTVPLGSNEAVLLWSYTPVNPVAGVPFKVLTASIVPNFSPKLNNYASGGAFGYTHVENDVRFWASVITPEDIYVAQSSTIPPVMLNQIQDILVKSNLGTVIQRQNYISLLHTSIDIQPFDFRFFLTKWILIGISIFLAIPLLWWVVKRFLK